MSHSTVSSQIASREKKKSLAYSQESKGQHRGWFGPDISEIPMNKHCPLLANAIPNAVQIEHLVRRNIP